MQVWVEAKREGVFVASHRGLFLLDQLTCTVLYDMLILNECLSRRPRSDSTLLTRGGNLLALVASFQILSLTSYI